MLVKRLLDPLPDDAIEMVLLTVEAADLAREYLRAGVVSTKMRVDAEHIALATVARVDVLVSWNFKHIVNLRRIQAELDDPTLSRLAARAAQQPAPADGRKRR